jgi:RNA recognition motif-containing protein
MALKVYLANLSSEISEDQIRAVFEPIGPVNRVKFLTHQKTGEFLGRALAWLETDLEPMAIFEQCNGLLVNGQRLAVTPVTLPPKIADPTPDQCAAAEYIAEQLGETDMPPRNQILEIVRLCGIQFAYAVLDETLEVEAAGGLPVKDGSRPRTRGGIFFFLARGRISLSIQPVIMAHVNPPVEKKKKPKPKGKGKASFVVTPPPPPPPRDIPGAQLKLDDLRVAHRAAQERLEIIKALPKTKQTGAFSALKEVLDLQRQIDAVLKEYPELA